jgi:hypothetical protein
VEPFHRPGEARAQFGDGDGASQMIGARAKATDPAQDKKFRRNARNFSPSVCARQPPPRRALRKEVKKEMMMTKL